MQPKRKKITFKIVNNHIKVNTNSQKIIIIELSQVALPLIYKKKNTTSDPNRAGIPSLHISGRQNPDLATALPCQGCHTSVSQPRQALPPQDHCWNAPLRDQPYHFLSVRHRGARELQPDSHFHNTLTAGTNHHRQAHCKRKTDGLVVTILHSHHKFGTAFKEVGKKILLHQFFFSSSRAPRCKANAGLAQSGDEKKLDRMSESRKNN